MVPLMIIIAVLTLLDFLAYLLFYVVTLAGLFIVESAILAVKLALKTARA